MKTVYISTKINGLGFDSAKMITIEPVLARKHLFDNRDRTVIEQNASYFRCKSFINETQNLYAFKSPIDMNVAINDGYVENLGDQTFNIFSTRPGTVLNRKYLNVGIFYYLFCEEPLKISLVPPYMHNGGFSKNGFVVPGSFDISSWYRPLTVTVELFENESIFTAKRGDPMFYVNFKEPVKFVWYEMTSELLEITASTGYFRHVLKNQPLENLYERFANSGVKKRTLKIIKKNIIE